MGAKEKSKKAHQTHTSRLDQRKDTRIKDSTPDSQCRTFEEVRKTLQDSPLILSCLDKRMDRNILIELTSHMHQKKSWIIFKTNRYKIRKLQHHCEMFTSFYNTSKRFSRV